MRSQRSQFERKESLKRLFSLERLWAFFLISFEALVMVYISDLFWYLMVKQERKAYVEQIHSESQRILRGMFLFLRLRLTILCIYLYSSFNSKRIFFSHSN